MSGSIKARIDRLDLSLFSSILTQSSEDDRRSWLAVQRAIRSNGYHYLEIGSYLGGSIQQHLVDPMCKSIISIDKRLFHAPDEREHIIEYETNSTEAMLEKMRRIDAQASQKIITFESDASDVDPVKLPSSPDFCFIDGEHTSEAVIADFKFCYSVCSPNAAICLHDSRIIYSGIEKILSLLAGSNRTFSAGRLPGDTFGIFFGDCQAATDPFLRPRLGNFPAFLRKMRVRHFFKSIFPKGTHSVIQRIFPQP
jgi:Methyltransferase domain